MDEQKIKLVNEKIEIIKINWTYTPESTLYDDMTISKIKWIYTP